MAEQGALRAPDDTALAWALAESVRRYLSAAETSSVHIAIAIGEQFAAIDTMVAATARERVHLDTELLATLTVWLDCYVGQDAEPRLRTLLGEIAAGDRGLVERGAPPGNQASSA